MRINAGQVGGVVLSTLQGAKELEGKLELKVGSVVRATLMQQAGKDEVWLQIGGKNVRARLDANVKPGDQVDLLVTGEQKQGALELKVVGQPIRSGEGKQLDIAGLVRALGLPETEETKALVQELAARGVPLKQETVRAALAVLRSLPQVTPSHIATLGKMAELGIPILPSTFEAMHTLEAGPKLHDLLTKIQTTLQGLFPEAASGFGKAASGGAAQPQSGATAPAGTMPAPSAAGTQAGMTPAPSAAGTQAGATPAPSVAGTQAGMTPAPSAAGTQAGMTPAPSAAGTQAGTTTAPSAAGTQAGATTAPSAAGTQAGTTPSPSGAGTQTGTSPLPSSIGTQAGTTPAPSAAGTQAGTPPAPSAAGTQAGTPPAPSAAGTQAGTTPVPSAASTPAGNSGTSVQTAQVQGTANAPAGSTPTPNANGGTTAPASQQRAAAPTIHFPENTQASTPPATTGSHNLSAPTRANLEQLLHVTTQLLHSADDTTQTGGQLADKAKQLGLNFEEQLAHAMRRLPPDSEAGQVSQAFQQALKTAAEQGTTLKHALLLAQTAAAELDAAGLSTLQQDLSTVLKNITGQQLMQTSGGDRADLLYQFAAVPIRHGKDEQTVELHVMARKSPGQKTIDPANCYVLFRLDMPNLGELDIHLHIVDKVVGVRFLSEQQADMSLTSADQNDLRDALQKVGFHLGVLKVEDKKQQEAGAPPRLLPPILTNKQFDLKI